MKTTPTPKLLVAVAASTSEEKFEADVPESTTTPDQELMGDPYLGISSCHRNV
jgi:hypothetical protein